MTRKTKKTIISIVLILLSYGFIIYKIANFEELKEITFSSQHYSSIDLVILLIVILLMFLNWCIETIKWKTLIDKIQYFSFISALQAVFSGITIGIFTPNRIGEIGGRVLFMEKGKRTFGVLATGIGSFAQFITTVATGIVGFVLILVLFPEIINLNPIFNFLSAFVLFLILLILILTYFNIKKIKPILLKISFFKTRTDQIEYLSETKFMSLHKVLVLSFMRYFVFASQFFLLLIFFNIHLTLIQAYISISLIYLFATLVPTTTLIELGIRGSLAIFFIGIFSDNVPGIILSTTLLWFVNLAIPSVIGSLFFVKNKL
ncbi:MAG: flippase-like domain-containing protein [Bacteroidales bacterium]|nr:flippase-like domain-containing protein [Bacteroidales bacterium]